MSTELTARQRRPANLYLLESEKHFYITCTKYCNTHEGPSPQALSWRSKFCLFVEATALPNFLSGQYKVTGHEHVTEKFTSALLSNNPYLELGHCMRLQQNLLVEVR